MDTALGALQKTILDGHILSLRTIVGAECFDQSHPDHTLRPGTDAMVKQAELGTFPHPLPDPAVTQLAEDPSTASCGRTALTSPSTLTDTRILRASAESLQMSTAGFASSNEYTLLRRVGKGGMGEIFLAGQNALRREVAVKKILPALLEGKSRQQIVDAFIAEALVTGFLDHPNIVPVHGLGLDESGNLFLSMKMVRGTEWRQLLHRASSTDDTAHDSTLARNLDVDDSDLRAAHLPDNLRILLAACNALAFAHSRRIVHRDLKPENIMVGAFGEVLVMDWGLAIDVSENPLPPGHPERRGPSRHESGIGGTPSYMAPEQFEFDATGRPTGAQLGCWTDVFLLGGILYELMAGHAPYSGQSLNAVLKKVAECTPPLLPDTAPAELVTICRKAMAKIPTERYPDALTFQKAVQDFLTHREAAAIAAKAESEARSPSIPNLARAVVLYDQALELWPQNLNMKNAAASTRSALAAKEGRAHWIRRTAYGLAITIFLCVTGGLVWIRHEQGKTEEARKTAVSALQNQKRMAFDAIVKNTETLDESGESERVIAALEPYLADAQLEQHASRPRAEELVKNARDGFERLKIFAEKVKAREKIVGLDLGHGVILEFILIPAGKFTMGSTEFKSEFPHDVTLTKPFYMGKFHVTQEQYQAVTGKTPSFFKGKPKNPVEQVSWLDADAFCTKLNTQSGAAKVRISLPTEAQWEYACRAGATTVYYFGDNEEDLKQYAWYKPNAFDVDEAEYGTHPVGLKKPNSFGLYDMHGNVCNWCQDWYDGEYYKNSPKEDPPGPKTGEVDASINTMVRVLRGGPWDYESGFCHCANRGRFNPNARIINAGFRVCVPLDF